MFTTFRMPAKRPRPVGPIEDAIADIKAGKMVILMDDENRENEGDLCLAAEVFMNIGKILRMKAAVARVNEERIAATRVSAKYDKVLAKAGKVVRLYEKYLNDSCAGNKMQAIGATAADLNLLAVDVRSYLTIYRQSLKESSVLPKNDQFQRAA